MPRGPRLDGAGVLGDVTVRGISRWAKRGAEIARVWSREIDGWCK